MKPILPIALVMALPLGASAQTTTPGTAPRTSSSPPSGTVERVTPPPAGVPVEMTRLPDGFARIGGNVYIVENGTPTRVAEERVMRVSPNGTVTNFDGRTWIIPAGQIVTRDGRAIPVTSSLLDSRAAESAARPTNENGNNYSGLAPTPPVSSTSAATSGTSSSNTGAQGGSASSAPFTGGPRTTNPNAYPASQSPTPNRNNGSGGQGFIDPATVPFGINNATGVPISPNPGRPNVGTDGDTGTNTGGTTNGNNNNGTGMNNGTGINTNTGTGSSSTGGVNAGAGTNSGAGVSTGSGTTTNTGTGTGTTNPNARPTGSGNGNATGTQGTGTGTSTGGNTNTGTRPSTGTTGGSGGTSMGGGGTSGGSAGGGGGSASGGGANGGGGR